MIGWLEEMDQALFLKLNGLHQPWLDQLMYYMSEELFWVPVYLVMLYLIFRIYDWKVMLLSLVGIALVVGLGDRISVELFKNVFQRYRPSRNLDLAELVHTVNGYRGGLYGFVSSHATNFFGIATFVYFLISKQFPKIAVGVMFWAGLIAYTRIYLGVHYPGDIAVGTILGFGIGYFVYRLFKHFVLKKRAA